MQTQFLLRPIGPVFLVASALALSSATAFAQEAGGPEVAVRRELIGRAQAADAAGNHAEALDLAERAGRISMSPSLRMFLAQQQNALGRAAEALGNAEQCVREGEHDPALPHRETVLGTCRQLVQALASRVAHITIRVPTPPDGLHVTVAGHEVNSALYGVPYVVTPGEVVVEATAPGRLPFRQVVNVPAGASNEITVQQALAPVSSVIGGSSSSPPVAAPPSGPGPMPIVLIGVGGASLVASAVLFVFRGIAQNQFETQQCAAPIAGQSGRDCFDTPTSHAQYNSYVNLTIAADVTLGVGIAAVAGGALWWVLGRGHPAPSRDRARIEISPLAGGALLTVGGAL